MKWLDGLLKESQLDMRSEGHCFAQKRLNREGKEYLAAVKAEFENGKAVVITTVTAILLREFGLKVGRMVVTNHLKGLCSCPTKRKINS